MDFKMVEIWGDGNITAALHWSQDLGKSAALPTSLNNLKARAVFIETFNQKYGAWIGENYLKKDYEKDDFVKETAKFARGLLSDILGTDEEVTSLIFRLWGACIITSKQIDVKREEITPDVRRERFTTILDPYGKGDEIFFRGMETAITYCRLKKENYSLEGIPKESILKIKNND